MQAVSKVSASEEASPRWYDLLIHSFRIWRPLIIRQVVPFKNVFDARDGVLAKTEDRRINAVDFTDNDVIVVEAELTRWKKSGSSGWSAFDVGFDLAAIFLLWDSS